MSRYDYLIDGPGDGTWFDALPVIRRLLRRHKRLAIIWSVEDVQWVCPDLDKEQAWEVLEHAELHHDPTIGINWDTFTDAADVLYPEREEAT